MSLMNFTAIALHAGTGKITMLNLMPLIEGVNADDALTIAAWLVLLAGADDDTFQARLAAVANGE